MPYTIEDHFLSGVPQTALVGGLASRGIAMHWTAGGVGRQGALDTSQFFIDRADRNASYHELWWWEADTFGVLRIVSPDRAAHSMNPQPPDWNPNTEVRRILGDKVGDPNAWSYAVSFAGMPTDLDAAMTSQVFVQSATRRIRELLIQETTIKVDRPLFNHGWGQPVTRYDAGPDLIPAIYAQLYAPPPEVPDDVIIRNITRQDWNTKKDTHFFVAATGEKKWFTSPERVTSVAEVTLSDGTNARLVHYGTAGEALLVPRWHMDAIPDTRVVGTGTIGMANCDAEKATIAAQTQKIADLQTANGQQAVAITTKNVAIDESVAKLSAARRV